ncbi:hypothetical protein [Desulfovibrio sp.]|uniref:hypothetical protein n=1 Tax=Desulfovibrio sp. TaxID=885 RepID=UPI0025C513FB|nr:hypothetical protein [Desulfovibrio sp.]
MTRYEWRRTFDVSEAAFPDKALSDAAFIVALRRMGYGKEEMCAHGFRPMASTLLNEQGYSADVIEKQLAHNPRGKIRDIYNR